jgi:hypothetical protein
MTLADPARHPRADRHSGRRPVSAKRPRLARGFASQAHLRRARPTGRHSGTSGVEHRGIVVPGIRLTNAHAERRRAGGTRRGNLGRHVEMPEDPADHGRLFDERDQTQAAATPGTRQHVEPKVRAISDAQHWPRAWRRAVSLTSASRVCSVDDSSNSAS